MSILTVAFYDVLFPDPVLAAWLAPYNGVPGVFSIEPVPGDARYPLIVTSGEVSQAPDDTKNCLGRSIIRDVRCFTEANGSAEMVEQIAERVRFLFHREPLSIPGYNWVISSVGGPIVADEQDYYTRILSVNVTVREIQNLS